MSPVLERVLTPEQRAQAAAEDAKQAAALKLHAEHFGHLGADRTESLKANAIGDAARETADRLSLTLARGYARHTTAEGLLVALERDSQSMAARCTSVQYAGFQATADGYMRALLRGQVLRLMGDLAELRAESERVDIDKDLEYVELRDDDLGDVTVGIEYEAKVAAHVTSASTFERTGDPGDPGSGEVCEVVECWFRGADIAHVLTQSTVDRLATKAAEKMRLLGEEAAEEHALARAGQ